MVCVWQGDEFSNNRDPKYRTIVSMFWEEGLFSSLPRVLDEKICTTLVSMKYIWNCSQLA